MVSHFSRFKVSIFSSLILIFNADFPFILQVSYLQVYNGLKSVITIYAIYFQRIEICCYNVRSLFITD